LGLEKVIDGSVSGTKRANVSIEVLLVDWVSIRDEALDSRVNLKASFRNVSGCGNNLGTFEFVRERDDASGRDSVAGEVSEVAGEKELRRKVLLSRFFS
jgi:hypothetical protein